MTPSHLEDRDDGPQAGYPADAVERTRLDPLFPRELIELKNGPATVWIAGQIPPGPRVAIVGSRAADGYGRGFASRLAADLALEGVPVVSGGAIGVDVAAHRGAVEAGGLTIAVLGTGIGVAYPVGHEALFARIARDSGALVSALSPGTEARPGQFPARNRMLVALADVVVVVQAAHARSGAMGSAREARLQKRKLMAVPGPAGALPSAGPHWLLQRREAQWCEGVADVLAALRAPLSVEIKELSEDAPDAGAEPEGIELASHQGAAQVWGALSVVPQTVEDITVAAGVGPGVARSALMWLESRGVVRYEAGGRYARTQSRRRG